MALCSQLNRFGCSCRLNYAKCSKLFHNFIRQNLLQFSILFGVFAGIVLGICLRMYVPTFQEPHLHPREVQYLYFPSEIYLRMMLCITLPLLVSALVSGIGSLDIKSSARTGLYIFGYYLSTTVIAIVEGFIYIFCIKPGINIDHSSNVTDVISPEFLTEGSSQIDSFMDMIRNMFPDNIVTVAFQIQKTSFTFENVSLASKNESILVQQFKTDKADAINILGLTSVSIIFAVALSLTKSKGKPMFLMFDLLFEAVMKIMNVLLCTMTLPVTMTCLKKLGYKDSIIHVMAPIGATINMDGTALYYAIAPVFVITTYGMNLGVTQTLLLGVTALVVSFGAPSSVDAMALYVIMFTSIGLPLKDIGVFLTFDWILSRLRTMVNVTGDCIGVAVVEKLSTRSMVKDVNFESKGDHIEMSHLNKAHQENDLLEFI